MRAVPLGKPVKAADRLLQKQLQPARHLPEFRDDEDAEQDRCHRQQGGYAKGRDQSGVDVKPAEQRNLCTFVKHLVAHHLTDGFLPLPAACQYDSDQQKHDPYGKHRKADRFLFFTHSKTNPPFSKQDTGNTSHRKKEKRRISHLRGHSLQGYSGRCFKGLPDGRCVPLKTAEIPSPYQKEPLFQTYIFL